MFPLFIGRIDDTGHDGMELIAEIMNTWANYDLDTKVLAASVRHHRHTRASRFLQHKHPTGSAHGHHARQNFPSAHEPPADRSRT